jgi:diguanylate cyclase
VAIFNAIVPTIPLTEVLLNMESIVNWLSVPGYVSDTMALAAVALIGYLFGHRSRQKPTDQADKNIHSELTRAVHIAKELQHVAGRIRKEVAMHQSSISRFQSKVGSAQLNGSSDAWETLTGEAEELLVPTMKLALNLSTAYDELRQHSSQLLDFTRSRSDLETGVGNRRALEEQLDIDLTGYEKNKNRFSLVLFSVEPPEGEGPQDLPTADLLRSFAELLEQKVRDTDLVTRYGESEFVVQMSQTTLSGAAVFSGRLLHFATSNLNCVVSGGIAEVQPGDTQEKLLSRANSALYSARSNGHSCLFQHNGKVIRKLEEKPPAKASQKPTECLAGAASEGQRPDDRPLESSASLPIGA